MFYLTRVDVIFWIGVCRTSIRQLGTRSNIRTHETGTWLGGIGGAVTTGHWASFSAIKVLSQDVSTAILSEIDNFKLKIQLTQASTVITLEIDNLRFFIISYIITKSSLPITYWYMPTSQIFELCSYTYSH